MNLLMPLFWLNLPFVAPWVALTPAHRWANPSCDIALAEHISSVFIVKSKSELSTKNKQSTFTLLKQLRDGGEDTCTTPIFTFQKKSECCETIIWKHHFQKNMDIRIMLYTLNESILLTDAINFQICLGKIVGIDFNNLFDWTFLDFFSGKWW